MLLRKALLCSIFFFSLATISLVASTSVSASLNTDLVNLINNYRTSKGIGKLSTDQKLTNAACWMAGDMAAKGYFSHTDSLGRNPFTRMDSFGVSGGSRGENIASLTNQSNSAQKIFSGWKASAGHNAIMLTSSYKRVGVANSYRSKNKTYYWVADFASGNASKMTKDCGVSSNTTKASTTKPVATQTEETKPTTSKKTAETKKLGGTEKPKFVPASTSSAGTIWKTYTGDLGQVLSAQSKQNTQLSFGLAIFLLVTSLNIFGVVAWLTISKDNL
ncbi:MAG: CAP domain-containing protein [bacterium]|nr:CAP domain-containing protein [bacterium]